MSRARLQILAAAVVLAGSAVTLADNLYVSDETLSTVEVFDANTGAPKGSLTPPGGWGLPTGIAVAADGTVYVADSSGLDYPFGVIYRFKADGTFQDVFTTSGLFEPTGIAFGPDGYLYVANSGASDSFVTRYNSSGAQVDATPFVPSSSGLYYPGAIAFGPGSKLYIADSSNDTIDVVTLPGGAFSPLIGGTGCPTTPFANPQGVAFGPDQNLYVSDSGYGCYDPNIQGDADDFAVYKYSTAGALLSTFVAPNILATPIDLAFGPDGNLYVTDSQARVARFNGTTGVEMADFVPLGGGLSNPTFLAFSEGAAAAIAVQSGSGQDSTVNQQFANPLVVKVTDQAGNPVQGITVTFVAPQSGASATFTGGNTAVTNSLGVATSNAVVADGTAGGPYNVMAISGPAAPATFTLTNDAPTSAVNVSTRVSITNTGFVINRVTHIWSSTMTVKNISGTAIAGPIDVLLNGLPATVTMTNSTGTFNNSPFIQVSSGSLAPGGQVSAAIQFTNPNNVFIAFTPAAYSGAL